MSVLKSKRTGPGSSSRKPGSPSKKPDAPEGLFLRHEETVCAKCKAPQTTDDPVMSLPANGGFVCLGCAGLGGTVYLRSGNVALTRRASKLSASPHPVLAWNRRAKRWERRGTMVDPEALAEAERQCEDDKEKRAVVRVKAQAREAVRDQDYIQRFAEAILEEFPGLDLEEARRIAGHACEKHSGRVGRTAAAKEFDREMVELAVVAYARHEYTNYDDLLEAGVRKQECRDFIREDIAIILKKWRRPRA